MVNNNLVGGGALPLWKIMEFVSWDYEIPNMWKVKTCSKPPTSQLFCDFNGLEKHHVRMDTMVDGAIRLSSLHFLVVAWTNSWQTLDQLCESHYSHYTTSFSSTFSVACKHLTNMSHFFNAKPKTLSSSEFVVSDPFTLWAIHPNTTKVGNCESVKKCLEMY